MIFKNFSKNGNILPISEATIALSNIEYSYGFGVYELLKIRDGIAYFEYQHVKRLFKSAAIIGLDHDFTAEKISKYIYDLLRKEKLESANLKIILLGAKTREDSQLFIFPLSPLYPKREYYAKGIKTITYKFQRLFPQAKTLNMLGSYLAYRTAKNKNCYDALLTNSGGEIIEGTRTNFFAIKNNVLYTQEDSKILEGLTRETLLHVAKKNGFKVLVEYINPKSLSIYTGAFLTSTTSKILPIEQIDDYTFPEIPHELKLLMQKYDDFLKESKGVFNSTK